MVRAHDLLRGFVEGRVLDNGMRVHRFGNGLRNSGKVDPAAAKRFDSDFIGGIQHRRHGAADRAAARARFRRESVRVRLFESQRADFWEIWFGRECWPRGPG